MIYSHTAPSVQLTLPFSNGGRSDVAEHLNRKHEIAKAASSYKPHIAQSVIEAEVPWATFMHKHNLAFLTSDHATKLFAKMFPDSEIVKKFACKTRAIIEEALALTKRKGN